MFANKVVIVTGGSAGIGAATAECFAKEGASVAIVGRNEEKLKKVTECLQKLGANVLTIKADVSKEDEVKTIIKQTIDKFGKLDVLVNNAGIVRFLGFDSENILETYDEVMNTNLRSVVQLSSLAIPYLKETKGNIINISSIASMKHSISGLGVYCISKAGMDCFTKALAKEIAPFGVRVNSINPGPVRTEIFSAAGISPEILQSEIGKTIDLGQFSESEEISDLILYLASDKGKSITGSCYVIDNGMMLK